MNARTLALDQYDRDRRRLNTRLGLLMILLIPLPQILLRLRFGSLEMLALVVVIALAVGVIYPLWWRSRNHPYREDGREQRTRRIAIACRTLAFVSLLGFMVSWVVGSDFSSWVALAFLVAGAAALIAGFEVEERWKRVLQRAAKSGADPQRRQGRHRHTPASPEDAP